MPDYKSLYPLPRAVRSPPYTVDAPGVKPVEGETVPKRNVYTKDELKTRPTEEIATIHDILKYSSAKFGNAKAVGHRKLVKTHVETKKIKKVIDGKEQEVDKQWTYFELSGYHYRSFIEFEKLALSIGAGFRALGMEKADRVHIFASTSPFWLAVAHGAVSQSMPIVTAYDTLGQEGLQHSLMQTRAKAMFLEPSLLPKLVKPLQVAKDLKHLIYNSEAEVKKEDIEKLRSEYPEITVMSLNELVELGESKPVDTVPPSPEDLCCIMYTSGSTGTPKGVLLKHKNVIASLAGVDVIVGKYLGPSDGLLTYLPLAHILEFVFENAVLYWGGTMGYGNPKTLSDQSVRNCKGDIREFRPSILVGVPAVWESVKKGIINKVSQSNVVVRNMFWGAMTAKSFLVATGLPGTSILDAIVFSKIRDATGGRLRICMNGGGPIAKETQHFISMAIAPMIGGYGLTETAAMGALNDPLAWTDKALGELTGCIEVKLVDFADAGYFTANKPPQGEIWIRGACVSDGYLDMEEETKEAFTSDGWFKTGDIGEFDSKGYLRIIDRKKNLVKTINGEYIALEKLESVYRSAAVVQNICVYAGENKAKPVAIIVPAEPALKKLAAANGVKGDHLEQLVHDPKLNSVVLKELQTAGRKGGLEGIEIIEGVVLADEEWTPQNGFTTAAQKLNRKVIMERYKKEIEKAYGSSS